MFTEDSPQRRLADPCLQPVSGTNGKHLLESLFMQECPWESLHLFTQSRHSPFMTAPSKWAACYQFVLDHEALGLCYPQLPWGVCVSECVCVCVCVCRGTEIRLTQHCCTVGNRPGTTDIPVPKESGGKVSRLEINERMLFSRGILWTLTSEMGCLFVWPRTRTEPTTRQSFRQVEFKDKSDTRMNLASV